MSNFPDAEAELRYMQAMATDLDDHEMAATFCRALDRIEALKAELAELQKQKPIVQLLPVPEGRSRHDGPFMLANHWLRLRTLPAGTYLYAGPAPGSDIRQ